MGCVLWDAAYDCFAKTASSFGNQIPKKEDFPSIHNITYTTTKIHGMGLILYSILAKEVEAEYEKKVKELTIELK